MACVSLEVVVDVAWRQLSVCVRDVHLSGIPIYQNFRDGFTGITGIRRYTGIFDDFCRFVSPSAHHNTLSFIYILVGRHVLTLLLLYLTRYN